MRGLKDCGSGHVVERHPACMAHPAEHAAAILIMIVSVILAILAGVAFKAAARAGNVKLNYVASAFAILALKGAITSFSMQTHIIAHGYLEFFGSVMDLAAVSLLIFPLLK